MPRLSQVFQRLESSPIAATFNHAVALRESGVDLVDLSTGEPDFDTPEHIKQSAVEALARGETKYTAVHGTHALRRAISTKFRRDNELEYAPEQIVVSNGAKSLLAVIFQALLDPEDEVMVPAPYWPSHVGMVQAARARVAKVQCGPQTHFKLTPEVLESSIGSRTKALVLCSPNNPTGATYSAAELEQLAEVLLRHPQLWIVSDDLYEHIRFDHHPYATMAQVSPELYARTITVNGVSKSYAMTGWRIGYAGAPQPVADAIVSLLSEVSGGPGSVSQAAALAALEGPQDFIAQWSQVYRRRRDTAVAALNATADLTVTEPPGGFYLFVQCAGVIGKRTRGGYAIESSQDFARYLLDDWQVAVVPGAGFGADPYFRISIASADSDLATGVHGIVAACEALQGQ